jgi:hypothetical protein
MAPSKLSTALPRGWSADVLYVRTSSYSKKLSAEEMKQLVLPKSDSPQDKQIYHTKGPYSKVRIVQVSDASHPAFGQCALHAAQHLPPDTFILPYLGYVHNQSDTDQTSNYDLSLDRELGVGVDASTMGNEARFINDYRGVSTAANAEFRDILVDIGNGKIEKRVGVFVLSAGKSGKRAKGIGRGEEILVSYGKGFWTERRPLQD